MTEDLIRSIIEMTVNAQDMASIEIQKFIIDFLSYRFFKSVFMLLISLSFGFVSWVCLQRAKETYVPRDTFSPSRQDFKVAANIFLGTIVFLCTTFTVVSILEIYKVAYTPRVAIVEMLIERGVR